MKPSYPSLTRQVMRFSAPAAVLAAFVFGSHAPGTPKVPAGKKPALAILGALEPAEQARLHGRIAGIVQKVNVAIGDRVRKGDVLAELAAPEVEAELRLKAAALAQAEAEFERARLLARAADANIDKTAAQILEAEAGVLRARVNHDYWKRQTERLERLPANAVDRATLDEAKRQLAGALAAAEEAEARTKNCKATHTGTKIQREIAEADVRVAQARIEAAKADVKRVEAVMQSTRVVSPLDGVVAFRNAAAGELVAPDSPKSPPLFVVVRTEVVRLVLAVPEGAVAAIDRDTHVQVEFAAIKGKTMAGKVSRIAPVIDPATRTVRVEIDLPNPGGDLRPGMSAVAIIGGKD